MPGLKPRTHMSYDDGRLVLSLPDDVAVLEGERLDGRFGVLAKELGLKPEIIIGGRQSVSAIAYEH